MQSVSYCGTEIFHTGEGFVRLLRELITFEPAARDRRPEEGEKKEDMGKREGDRATGGGLIKIKGGLDEAGFLHRLLERRAELGGRVDHDDAGLFERGDLVLGLALATRDDGTGVTHCEEGERFIRHRSVKAERRELRNA